MKELNIIDINVYDNFTIKIHLNNNKLFLFDIKPYLHGEGLRKLRQLSFFKQAKFKDELIYWDENHDFPLDCMNLPSFLYL